MVEERKHMYVERDLENNQLYVNFGADIEDGAVVSTTEVFPGVYLDVSPDGRLVGIDIVNTKEAIGAAAADLTLSGELLGVKEAAQLVGKDPGNFIRDLASRPDFPKPVARVASGQLWFSKDIERYLEKRRDGAPQEEVVDEIREPLTEGGVVDEIREPLTEEEVVVEKRPGTKFQIYQDRKGEYRWRLRARNGEIIADGNEGYSSKASCEHGIDLVKEQAASAEVEDQTEGQAAQADRTEEEGLLDKAKRRLQE
jgi:uncharacterized protein